MHAAETQHSALERFAMGRFVRAVTGAALAPCSRWMLRPTRLSFPPGFAITRLSSDSPPAAVRHFVVQA